MLLLLLLPTLLPKLLQTLELTTQIPDPPKILQKPITDCPSVGYFFERQDLKDHPGTCYLCYCKDDGLAGCTLRDSERCDGDDNSYQKDVEAVQHNGPLRRRTRRGLMELFFNDAKKDSLMKSMVQANDEDCKPKDSKSIGCPPEDWCKGCLVCDCAENGEWQCHVMSFCENKTPRPGAKKIKKPEIKEAVASENDEENKITAKTNKKSDKRSVKPKKRNPRKVSSTTSKKPEMLEIISTTTKKPAAPQIGVRTLKKFIRKDEMKNGTANVLIIKKYISTISPIESPELLKYKNDSRKLAQLLYQQYEASASTKQTHTAKREIKLEKFFNKKQKRNFELKYNARGRKPMNVKEHSDWNKKMKAKSSNRQNKSLSNFYSKQNELLNPDVKNEIHTEENENYDTKIKGNYKIKEKVIYIPRKRRNKRDILPTTEVPSNSTIREFEKVNNSTGDNGQVSEPTSGMFGSNEDNKPKLKNYKYTVDDLGTQTYNYEQGTVDKDTVYETTLKYADLTTTENKEFKKENVAVTNKVNYATTFEESTTEQREYDSQLLDFKNYTLTETTYSPVSEQSLETVTSIINNSAVMSDKELKDKGNRDLEITTINDYITEDWQATEKQEISSTYNNINNITNEINDTKANLNYKNMIITDLNTYELEKNMKGDISNGTASPKQHSMNRTLKSFKTEFEKMLHSFSTNDTKHKPQRNGMIAIKYLKKMYNQFLSNNNNKTRLNNIVVLESICDSFGPCKISTKKVGLLNNKITELIIEAKKALNVIKMIKGHLQLVDSRNNNTDDIKEEEEFKRNIKQLNAILTDSYEAPLTEIEMTQMNYVKNKTKDFINSVENFASILNVILKIIHSEKMKFDNLKKRRKLIINRVTRHKLENGPLHKIKSLFLKFNLLQNTFMHNMYQAITELEKHNKNNQEVDKSNIGQRDKKYQTSVDKYMNKINYNLEKLKDLALKMGAKQRQKRDAMRNDDAVEYLLTLMEYLLKQNNPVDTPPVADGIDLLIDAIRRAPDIKPIKNNVRKQMSSMPQFPYFKPTSKSSSESEEDGMKTLEGTLKENLSFEKPYSNDTLILTPSNDELEEYRKSTSEAPTQSTTVTTSKYVDVEDLVFNGNVVQKVYMATIPEHDTTDETFTEKEEIKQLIPKTAKSKLNESASGADDDTLITMTKADTETEEKNKINTSSTTENTIKTQFDRLNEEYEKEMKAKSPSVQNLKIKRRKPKRPRKKQKGKTKSDVSSITKEVDEVKTKKEVGAEEAILRKRIGTSDVDPFQSMDDETASRDVAPLDAIDNKVFPSYFA